MMLKREGTVEIVQNVTMPCHVMGLICNVVDDDMMVMVLTFMAPLH